MISIAAVSSSTELHRHMFLPLSVGSNPEAGASSHEETVLTRIGRRSTIPTTASNTTNSHSSRPANSSVASSPSSAPHLGPRDGWALLRSRPRSARPWGSKGPRYAVNRLAAAQGGVLEWGSAGLRRSVRADVEEMSRLRVAAGGAPLAEEEVDRMTSDRLRSIENQKLLRLRLRSQGARYGDARALELRSREWPPRRMKPPRV